MHLRIGILKGILIIVSFTNFIALLLAEVFYSPLPLIDTYWESFCLMLFILSVLLFAIAGTGGFRRQTFRFPGDKDPSHYLQDSWTGSEDLNAEGPAFIVSGVIIMVESIAIGLFFL